MKHKIECYGLKKSFGNKTVLDGLDVNIIEGETFVLIGQSGVGKSVLLKLIIGLIKPDEGDILFDGVNLEQLSDQQWIEMRMHFGMLFQGGALFDSLTVGQNLLFALDHIRHDLNEREVEDKVLNTLDMVGLSGIEDVMPSDLSGGMMKRVALARAIVTDPDVVLFDEPTTGLDPITTASINELIVRVKKSMNTTFVIVTHDIKSAQFVADRVGMIYKGKMIFTGIPTELDTTDNPYIRQFIKGSSDGPIVGVFNDDLKKLLAE